MNRHLKSLIVSAVMVVFSITGASVAEAVDCGELGQDCFSRVYAGITGGEASISSDALNALDVTNPVDAENLSYGFVFGYRMNKFFGLESLGNYFGDPEYLNGGSPTDTRICNLGFGANFYLPVGEVISDPNLNFISLFARVGMHYWDAESDDPLSVPSVVYEDDGIDPFTSLGINLDLSRVLALRAEYTNYELGGDDKVVTQNMSLLFKF
jgi:hypothetical protein